MPARYAGSTIMGEPASVIASPTPGGSASRHEQGTVFEPQAATVESLFEQTFHRAGAGDERLHLLKLPAGERVPPCGRGRGCPEMGAIPSLVLRRRISTVCKPWETVRPLARARRQL